jgi:hypothetical protein
MYTNASIRFINLSVVSDCCLTPTQQFFSYLMGRRCYIRWDDNNVHFVLDQDALFDLYCSSSMKRKSADRHVAPFGHMILIPG